MRRCLHWERNVMPDERPDNGLEPGADAFRLQIENLLKAMTRYPLTLDKRATNLDSEQLKRIRNALNHQAPSEASSVRLLTIVGQVISDREAERARMGILQKFPEWWHLFRFFLPEKIEREAFEPAYNDMLRDYYLASRRYKSRGARVWLTLCFTFRTFLMLIDCLRLLAPNG